MQLLVGTVHVVQEEPVKPSPKKQKLSNAATAAKKDATPAKKAKPQQQGEAAKPTPAKKVASPKQPVKSKAAAKAAKPKKGQRVDSESDVSGSEFSADEVSYAFALKSHDDSADCNLR